MALTIKTNRQWRNFVYRSDVPAKVLADQFSHLGEEDAFDGYFCYRKRWYHLSDFMGCTCEEFKGWDGYASDSYFSGVLLKVASDGEQYQVATYFS